MSPDRIKEYITKTYAGVIQPSRILGGWSFYYGEPMPGYESNRLMRVKRPFILAGTNMKLAATSRRYQLTEFVFQGSDSDLKFLMDKEIAIYLADRRQRPYNHPSQSIFAPGRPY